MSTKPQTLTLKVTNNGLVIQVGSGAPAKAHVANSGGTRSISRKVRTKATGPLWRFQKRGPAIFISEQQQELF